MLSEQQQRIMGYFIEEAKDHLNTIEQGLLNLQATIADPEMVNELFRAAHSVKGGAAMLGLTSIQNTSHRLEDYFKVLKECPIKIDQKLETLLLRVYDTLQELLEQLQGPFGLTDDKAEEAMAAVEPTFAELNNHLAQLVSQAGVQTPEDVDLAVVVPVAAAAKPSPARALTEESALRFIFQNDVPARLREMLHLFKQADTLETRQQLQALCQTLAQPGEQLDLSDWCQLLDTAERAILNPDNTYRTLAPIVIKEIKRAQEQILTSNSAQVTASADLLALVPPEPFPAIADVTDTDLADLLGATAETNDQFDLFSEEMALGEMTSSEEADELVLDEIQADAVLDFSNLSDTSPELAFDTSEPELELTFDALAPEEDNALDLSFISQFDEVIPASNNNQSGPEVGVAELNSLADLFEGEDSELGLAWQEEVVNESAEAEPESLEFDDPSNDFSDLLFQDSEALELDESEEDLSGLLNKSAQQADATPSTPDTDVFTFGEPTAEADSADFDLLLFDQPSASEPNLEADLFGQVSETDPALDALFSKEVAEPQSDDLLGGSSFDALFVDSAESSVDGSPASNFDFAELENEFEGSSNHPTPELGLDSELDVLDLSSLDLSLDDEELPNFNQADLNQADLSPLLPESADSLELDLDLSLDSPDSDSLDSSDLNATASPSSEADLGFWQPEVVSDPWGVETAEPDLLGLGEPDLATENLFSLEAEPEDLSAANWMDLELSEPIDSLDALDSELQPGATTPESLESLNVESLDFESLDSELNSPELNFQTLDDSTLEVLNQPNLELSADEAADLDFNFEETASDASINSPESDLIFADLTEDTESLDFIFDPSATAPVESVESVKLVEEEVVFHFGAPTEQGDELDSAALSLDGLTDDLINDDTDNLELDLFNEPGSDLSFAAPSTADLDLDANYNAGFDFTGSEDPENATADLQAELLSADLDITSDLFAVDLENVDAESAEIDALLLVDSEMNLATDSGLSELAELDNLNLDEFALPDDFSDDSTTLFGLSSGTEEPDTDTDLSGLFTAEVPDSTVEAPSLDQDFDAFVESAPDAAVELPAPENPFANRTLEALFESEEELESPPDFGNFDQLGMELDLAETPLTPAEGTEVDLEDQTVDMRLFDSDFSSNSFLAAEPLVESETSDTADLAELDFDLFATENPASEITSPEPSDSEPEFDLEASLLDSFGVETELTVPGDTATEADLDTGLSDLSLESLNFEELETDDFGSTDATTELSLDEAFSIEGIENENLLEFAPDDRTDSALEDDLIVGFAAIGDSTVQSEATPIQELTAELVFDELDNEPADLSLDFDFAAPAETTSTETDADLLGNDPGIEFDFSDLELETSSDFDLGASLGDENLSETNPDEPNLGDISLNDADLSMDALFNSEINEAELSSDLETSLGDVNLSETNLDEINLSDISLSDADLSMDALFNSEINESELSFEPDFGSVSSAEAAEAELEFDLSDFEATDQADLADDLADDDLNMTDLDNLGLSSSNTADLDTINFDELDSELDIDLNRESALNLSELDSVDDLEIPDVDSLATEDLTTEGDFNDLDLGDLFEVDSLPVSSESLLDNLGDVELELDSDTGSPEPSESFDTSLSEIGFDDLDSMLMEDGTVEMGAVSAEPAEFDDLEAMLAEDTLPTTAIHVEEDENETEIAAVSEVAIDDDFADLEALLDNAPEAELVELAVPISSPPIEVEDEFSDLEALLQDADQTLGVGSSPTRKASTTANRRTNRRGGLSDQTMRVTVKHLDNLNNLVGEMVVNRNSLEQAQERLRQFLDNLLYQVQQLSDVGQRMRDLYERSLLESSLLSGRRGSISASISGFGSAGQPNHAAGMSFDALEMDRFTGFHVLSQEMIELIVRVRESASDIDFVVEETDQVTRNFRQITTQLQEGLTRSRMVPFSQTADRLPRGVRDNSLKYGKQAELIIEGRDTLIDKMIVEQLYDPMTHLVNNAIAHGIETPEERIAAGKSPTGQIVIRTFHQGNQTVISVSDDGAGINPERVRAKALAKGLINAAQAREMSRLDTYDLLFHHGFSTVDQIDDLRGRGVGLDVVRNNLNEIRGTISIDSTVGKGTTFTIRLPLTLSISKALCCISNRARIAFPMDGVEDMLDVPKERIQTDEQGQPCIQWRDAILPFQPLSDLLRYNRVLGRGSVYGGNQEEDVISIVVLRSAGNFLALQVDQVLGEQEIVIKQLEGPAPKPLGVAGATVLGDGRIMPIADVLELIDLWQGRIRRESGGSLWDKGEAPLPPEPAKTESTVLIVDDSITVRELLSMTFNKVGYRVEQARDGQEAWEKLRSGLPCDLVFCDIEMPRMDGLELLSRIQKDSNLSHLPIAMLTSRGADRHRQMAVQLGAKGYFTKPYLEEVLLDAAQRMLKGEVMIPGVNTQ